MNKFYKLLMIAHFMSVAGVLHVSATTPVASTAATLAAPGGSPNGNYGWYTNEFGPLNSNYSMGDFVRYTVTPGSNLPVNALPKFTGNGLNVYYGIADIAYAQDVYQYGINAYNLYNFIGYLFAGYAALNINQSLLTRGNWLARFRQSNQWMAGSLGFDNNPLAEYTVQLVDFTQRTINELPASAVGFNTGTPDTGQYLVNARTREDGTSKLYSLEKANASCSWFAYDDDGSYVLAVEQSKVPNIGAYVAPYGQYFGARLSHILGAVVNDIPKSTNVVTMMPSNANSPVPQMAIMNGGPYATAAAAPAGITTPSTAHFGSMQNYLTDMASTVAPGLKNTSAYAYLQNHILPTVSRLSTLCSYAMSSSSTPSQNNLIEIVSENITAYDNGVVLAIQNNTGDALSVSQKTSAGKNNIGQLKRGMNHHFLHTASLMDGVTASTAGAQVEPVASNMIEIQDLQSKANVYLQVLSGVQLQALVAALNTALGTISGSSGYNFSYNQGGTYSQPEQASYFVVTNFNPTTITSTTVVINEVLMYRVQAVNLEQFQGQPYFATLQIDQNVIGNGLYNNQLVDNSQGSSILYPSIVSVKKCLWTNPYDRARGKGFYSSIPLLLIPDTIAHSGITGLQAHYGIWLMSYAAALTEFQFGFQFGDNVDCLINTFHLFDSSKNIPARVVIDASGSLASGKILPILLKTKFVALMGSDVWDIGNDFHQDIPILNLYQNGNDIVANKVGGDFVNFAVMFETLSIANFVGMTPQEILNAKLDQLKIIKSATASEKRVNADGADFLKQTKKQSAFSFEDAYQASCENMMLFSLRYSDLQNGVIAILSRPKAGNYRLEFKDASGNVLAIQEIELSEVSIMPTISFNFLNSQDPAWSSVAVVPKNVSSQVKVGETVSLKITVPAGKINKFVIQPAQKAIKKIKTSKKKIK